MKKTHLYVLAALLIAAGLSAFFYKWKVLKFPITPVEQAEVWEVQARVEYQPRSGANRVVLQIPLDPPGYSILDENFMARSYGMNTERSRDGRSREVQWTIRRARGTQALYYRATIYRDGTPGPDTDRPQLQSAPELEEPFASAAQSLLQRVREHSIDSASFAAELLREFASDSPSQEVTLLLQNVLPPSCWPSATSPPASSRACAWRKPAPASCGPTCRSTTPTPTNGARSTSAAAASAGPTTCSCGPRAASRCWRSTDRRGHASTSACNAAWSIR